MATLFVNRNEGAKVWAERQGFEDVQIVESFKPDMVKEGDTVLGTLPLPLVAAVNEAGAEFQTLVMNVPAELRGQSISADQMEALGAKLEPLSVEKTAEPEMKDNVIVVTRHAGAQEWLKRQGVNAETVTPTYNDDVKAQIDQNTTVVGVLPPALIKDVQDRGSNFVNLDIIVPRELFKEEISADKMEELGAGLTGYKIELGGKKTEIGANTELEHGDQSRAVEAAQGATAAKA